MTSAGIVLCGGQSSRMGRPKAWLPCGGETMLGRVVRILGEVVQPIVVVAAPGQELPPLPAEVVLARDQEKGRGPLEGLAAGLAALPADIEAAYVSSCDVPLLRPAFVKRLLDLLGEHAMCVPRMGGYQQPLAAVYRATVLPIVRRLLQEDRRGPAFLFQEAPTRFVAEAEVIDVDPDLRSLRNVNTPEEYEQALRDIEKI